jgi:glyoxylase-like metal-dependent hydrolase (beta-lactamase superfamily II)
VVVSHFHGDHVAGLRDLPRARISAGAAGVAQVLGTGAGWRHGLLPALLPPDLPDRFDPVERAAPLTVGDGPGHDLLGFDLLGFDLLGDGSLVAVPLPGHLPGHLGLLLTAAGRQVLLVGDAAWSLRAIREQAPPSRLAAAAVHDGPAAAATLARLHRWHADHPELVLLPAHCPEAATRWREVSGCVC